MDREQLKKKEDKHVYILIIPFSQRLQKDKMEKQFSRFLDVFKKIEMNIPFAEALTQMPNYAKFFKDILSTKRNFAEKLSGELDSYMQCSDPEELTREDAESWKHHHSLHHWEF